MVFLLALALVFTTPTLQHFTSSVETRGLSSQVKVYDLENSLVGLAHKEKNSLLIKSQWIAYDKESFQKDVLTSRCRKTS